MESYLGGFSSSSLATRRGLDLDQAYGVYLTDKRLIVTKENASRGLGWDINVGSMFGTITSKVTPFFDAAPRTVSRLDASVKKLDVSLNQILMIELKRPSLFSKGHIAINLRSGDSFKLMLLESEQEFGRASFDATKELFQKHLPQILRT